VTANDSDPNGDLLTVSLVGDQPDIGQVKTVQGGRAFQIELPADATGVATFTYEADDGRGGTDTARVTVTVRPEPDNEAPKRLVDSPVRLGSGASVTVDVLADWLDPDGDQLYLKNARIDQAEELDTVRFRQDGGLTFQDAGTATGVKTVAIMVSDGVLDTEALVTIEVHERGVLPPTANGDHVTGFVGDDLTVNLLSNDTDPDGGALRLTALDQDTRLTELSRAEDGQVVWQATEPLTAYLLYTVQGSQAAATGQIRVDVVARPVAETGLPAAVPDRALLPAGESALQNVLWNDIDPAGGVLALVGAASSDPSKVSASVLEYTTLQVNDLVGGFDGPVTVVYQVANQNGIAEGKVTVLSVAPPEGHQPPVVVDDQATVRVDDIVTINVLENDYHPNGLPFEVVDGSAAKLDQAAEGLVFTSGDTVRFRAGSTPGKVLLSYQVTDNQNDPVTGTIAVQVVAADPEANRAPQPRALEGAAVAGGAVSLTVPLDGIDPDGDHTAWVGLGVMPLYGEVTYADGVLKYTAVANPAQYGTDRFTYLVQDRWGKQGEATVSIGLVAPSGVSRPPVAVDTQVFVRPGRLVAVAPIREGYVTDPDGDPVSLVSAQGLSEAVTDVEARRETSQVVFRAPDEEGFYAVSYLVEDSFGAQATGGITVRVGQDAPLLPPLPHDDVVTVEQAIEAAQGTGLVEVNVLANDRDPDGVAADDALSLGGPVAGWVDGVVTVQVTEEWQIIDYTLTDQDGLTGQAFIIVPGVARVATPVLDRAVFDPAVGALEVEAQQTVDIRLADVVSTQPGRTPKLVDTQVRVTRGSGQVVNVGTVQYTAPAEPGPDAVTVRVTDADDPASADALVATVSIPVTVTAPAPENPETVQRVAVELTAGELQLEPGNSAQLDLSRYAQVFLESWVVEAGSEVAVDPVTGAPVPPLGAQVTREPVAGASLTFEKGGGGLSAMAGLETRVDGQTLVAAAQADTPLGQEDVGVTVTAAASDVAGTATATASFRVRVVQTTREPPVAVADTVDGGINLGDTATVAVLANDHNPFGAAQPLTVTNVVVVSGQATVEVAGDKVKMTPAATFTGTVTARYTIKDAAGRTASALVTVTVLGPPDRPTGLVVDQTGDGFVVLRWAVPANNGSPLARYEVTGYPSFGQTCTSNVCRLEGLTNGTEYTFTVVAWNAVGPSEESAPSAPARPDRYPNLPAAPSVTRGDQTVEVSWSNPGSSGSPVTSYDVQISPAPATGEAVRRGVTGTSLTFSGLANGTSHKVRVCAKNLAVATCDAEELWGPWSTSVVPAGLPRVSGVAAVATGTTGTGGNPLFRVTWVPDGNGEAIRRWELSVACVSGGQPLAQLSAEGNVSQAQVGVEPNTCDLVVTVTIENSLGESEPAVSPTIRSVLPPSPVSGLTADPDCDGCAVVSFTPGSTNGFRTDEVVYEYRVYYGGPSGTIKPGGVIGDLQNGACYTIEVRPVATRQDTGEVTSGQASGLNQVCPYGPPIAPTNLTAAPGEYSVTFQWDPGSLNGHADGYYSIQVDGVSSTLPLTATSYTAEDLGEDQVVIFSIRTVVSQGPASEGVTVSGKARARGYLELVQSGSSLVLNYFNVTHGPHLVVIHSDSGDISLDNTGLTCYGLCTQSEMSGSVDLGSYPWSDGERIWVTWSYLTSNEIIWHDLVG
jgi:hypothetical protein